MFSSLQSRISAAMFSLVVICTIAGMFLTTTLLIRSHRDSVKRQLEATGTGLITMGIRDFDELSDFNELNLFVEGALQMEKVDKIIRVFDSSKKLLFTTVGPDYDLFPTKLKGEVKKPYFSMFEGANETYQSLIIPYKGKWGRQFYLQIAIPLPKYGEIFAQFWLHELIVLISLLVIALIVSHTFSLHLTKPIRFIAKYVQGLDPHNVEDWKPIENVKRGQYLEPIINGINLLTDRTRLAVQRLRKMTRYVSHELRTPLTILQGEAETVLAKSESTKEDYEKILHSSLEEIERMSEIVSTVSRVAEDERIMKNFQPQQIDLKKWILKNMSHWEKTLGRNIKFDSNLRGPVDVNLDPKLLFRLIDNLIRNVKKHTPINTKCTIMLKHYDNKAAVEIKDSGPGIPDDVLNLLNDPAAILETSAIGLSLCRRISEICRIGLKFANRPTGGLAVELKF
jgi:signal transduction histidine kinase